MNASSESSMSESKEMNHLEPLTDIVFKSVNLRGRIPLCPAKAAPCPNGRDDMVNILAALIRVDARTYRLLDIASTLRTLQEEASYLDSVKHCKQQLRKPLKDKLDNLALYGGSEAFLKAYTDDTNFPATLLNTITDTVGEVMRTAQLNFRRALEGLFVNEKGDVVFEPEPLQVASQKGKGRIRDVRMIVTLMGIALKQPPGKEDFQKDVSALCSAAKHISTLQQDASLVWAESWYPNICTNSAQARKMVLQEISRTLEAGWDFCSGLERLGKKLSAEEAGRRTLRDAFDSFTLDSATKCVYAPDDRSGEVAAKEGA